MTISDKDPNPTPSYPYRHLDRMHLAPTQGRQSQPSFPHPIRGQDDHTSPSGHLTRLVTWSWSSPPASAVGQSVTSTDGNLGFTS